MTDLPFEVVSPRVNVTVAAFKLAYHATEFIRSSSSGVAEGGVRVGGKTFWRTEYENDDHWYDSILASRSVKG